MNSIKEFVRMKLHRVRDVVKQVEPHDSVERYSALGVDCVAGDATIESPYQVRVGERVITTRNIVIATGVALNQGSFGCAAADS